MDPAQSIETSAPQNMRGETIQFEFLVRTLLVGKRTILICGCSALIAAALLAFLLPLHYTASASFVPPGVNSENSTVPALTGQLSALGGFTGKSQSDLFVGILRSHTIARDIIQRFDLQRVYNVKKESRAEKILEANSLFETDAKDPIVTVDVTDKSPERARDLANGYISALQSVSGTMALTESSQRRLFYEHRLAQEKDELSSAEVALKQAEEKTGLIAPAGQTSSEIQTLAQLRAQITDRQVRLASLLHDETPENPDVVRLRDEISSLQSKASQMESGQSREEFGHFSAAQVPGLELEYVRKSRDVKYHEALFDILAKQYEAARLDEAKDSPLQVLDVATVPDTKSSPHRSIIMAVGLLLGLVSGCIVVLWKAFQEGKMQA